MPFVPFANTAEVEVRYSLDDQQVENTLYFRNSTAFDITSLDSLAAVVGNWAVTSLLPLQNNVTSLREVVARDLSIEESFEVTFAAASGSDGGAGAPAPNNVSLCISFRSGITGRSQRGRNYLVGVPTNALAATNVFDSDYIASIVGAYNDLLSAALDAGFHWVIASRFHNGAPRLVGQTVDVLTVIVVDSIVDSQRRRLPGRGR